MQDLETRAGGEVEQADIGRLQIELSVGVARELGFDGRPVLGAEIVSVTQLDGADGPPVGRADGCLVEVRDLAEQPHRRGRGTEVGVGLVARAEEELAGEARAALPFLDLGEEFLGAAAHIGRHCRRLQGCFEVGSRDFVGAQAVVEHAELQTHARQIGIDQQHALERRNGAFQVVVLAGERGEGEENVEVGRLLHHLLKGRVVARLDVRWTVGALAYSLTGSLRPGFVQGHQASSDAAKQAADRTNYQGARRTAPDAA